MINFIRIFFGKFCDVIFGDFEVYLWGSSLFVMYVNFLNILVFVGFLVIYEIVKVIFVKYVCGKLDIYGILIKLGDSFGEFVSY